MRYNPELFAEKYRLAVAAAAESKPQGGLCGIELEWNLLDSQFRPLLTVGSGPFQQSFVDYLRTECLSPWLREYQPARSLPLDDRMGYPPLLSPSRRDLRSAHDGSRPNECLTEGW